jgi:peptidoglycan hydrolase-like protein with peptidoglycan-binding domain
VQQTPIRYARPDYIDHRFEADYIVTVAYWQASVYCAGLYTGPADGYWGPNSRAAVQQDMRRYGYNGPIDGVWGTSTWRAIQQFATREGTYRGPIDGVPGRNTWEGIFYAVVPFLNPPEPDDCALESDDRSVESDTRATESGG